jgi:hypothetical protein
MYAGTPCIEWTGGMRKSGYGYFKDEFGKQMQAIAGHTGIGLGLCRQTRCLTTDVTIRLAANQEGPVLTDDV